MCASGSLSSNPPIPRTRLIGRETERASARSLLLDEAVPLLTLTGPGGVGKTRLALTVAAEVNDQYEDGVAFIPLAPIRDATLVMPTIARVLGVVEVPGVPIATTLAATLAERHLLLVLDNLEQVAVAAPLLAVLLEACPQVQILATSRVRLHLGVEHLLPVPPLSVPAHHPQHLPEGFAESDAVVLFVERARQGRPDFAVTPANAATIAAIVERLDGLPLAIELAAARLSALTPEALLAHLDHRLRLLRGSRQDLPPRLRSMADAIAWSYDLLDADEQALLRRLGVFLGGWTLAAAEAVSTAAGDVPLRALDGITSLVDQSLISPLPAPTTAPRYTMLETVREFSLERLEETGELAAAREAHATWCLSLAEEAEPHLGGAAQGLWLERLEIEHDNLRAALNWWHENGEADRGLRLATALMRFWDTRDYMSEGRAHLLAFLALAKDVTVTPQAKARALAAAGELATWEARHAQAASLAEQALSIWRALDDHTGITYTLWLLGTNTLGLGDASRAWELASEGVTLARRTGDREAEALHLRLFGAIHGARGESAQAIPFFEAALSILRECDARAEICSVLGGFALILGHHGDRERAIGLWEQVLPLAREVGEAWMIAYYLEGHAELALDAGHPDLAARWLGTADTWRTRHNAPVLGVTPSTTRALATARTRLGEDAFVEALAGGQALSLEAAVQEVQDMLAAAPASLQAPTSLVPEWATAHGLTPREYEVMQLLVRRLTDREIATALFVSPRTVHGHVASLLDKLGVANRREVALLAPEHGVS